MNSIKIAIGSDHGGYELKSKIIKMLEKEGYPFKDFGTLDGSPVDYPIVAKEVSLSVANGQFDRGIIICGSGLGVAIAANKVKGIRAVTCHDTYSSKMSRLHNNANVLTMGGRVIGDEAAFDVVRVWLTTEFEGGRHQRRVDMLEG